MKDYSCPNCGGQNTQKVSLAYQSGVKLSAAVTVGGAAATASEGLAGAAISAGQSSTILAAHLRPPVRSTWEFRAVMGALILFFGATTAYAGFASSNADPGDPGFLPFCIVTTVLCLLVGVACIRSALKRREYNETQFSIDAQAWDKKFICMRCATVFSSEPEDPGRLTSGTGKTETPDRAEKQKAKNIGSAVVVAGLCFAVIVIGILMEDSSSAPVSAPAGPSPVGKYSSYMTDATYEGAYAAFQQTLPKLDRSTPNLRELPTPALNPSADNPQDWQLVTPYGPCADVVGGANGGYFVDEVDGYRSTGSVLNTIYRDRDSATKVAEEYCHRWYAAAQPAANQLFWFEPDIESAAASATPTPSLLSPEAADQNGGNTAPEPVASASTIPTPSPLSPGTADQNDGDKAPEPAAAAGQAEKENRVVSTRDMRWELQSNGDEVLIGPSGKCATLALLSAHDPNNNVHLNLANGQTGIFPVNQTAAAMQAAKDYCATKK